MKIRKFKITKLNFNTVFIATIILIVAFSSNLNVKAFDETVELSSDPLTLDSYVEQLTDYNSSTKDAGKIWADKSVLTGNGENPHVDVDGNSFTSEDPILEVFSALGVKHQVTGEFNMPADTVIILDISKSMGIPDARDGRSRIEVTVEAVNKMIDYLMSSNEKNRVAVALFSSRGGLLLPLDHYTKEDGGDYLTLKFDTESLQSSDTETSGCSYEISTKVRNGSGLISNSFYNTTFGDFKDYPVEHNLEQETNLEAGLETGLSALRKDERYLDNIPNAILITDGQANNVYESSWEENQNPDVIQDFGDPQATDDDAKWLILKTLLTAAYQRSLVEASYNYPLDFKEIGIAVNPNTEKGKAIKLSTLDPRNNFIENSDNEMISSVYEMYKRWYENDEDIKLERKPDTPEEKESTTKSEFILNSFSKANENGQVLVEKESINKNINYIDSNYDIEAENIEDVLSGITQEMNLVDYPMLDPNVPNVSGDIRAITYDDPIGEYMRLGEIKGLILFSKVYPVKEVKTSDSNREFRIQVNSDKERFVNNPNYSEEPVDIEEIKIKCLVDDSGNETLRVVIPESLLPVVMSNIKQTVEADSSTFTNTSDSEFSKPFRLVYSIKLSPELIDGDSLNSDIVDADYRSTHTIDEKVVFYSNSYGNESRESANVSFVPSAQNPYYFNQENRVIYTDENDLENSSLKSLEELDDDKIYYYKDSHFILDDNGKPNRVEELVSRKGSELRNQLSSQETDDGNLAVFFVPGGNMLGEDTRNDVIKSQNNSLTAQNSHEIRRDEDNRFRINLGNNAKIAATKGVNQKLKLFKSHTVGKNEATKVPLKIAATDIITYFLTVSNVGDVKSENFILKDKIPDGLILQEDSISDGGYCIGDTVYWEIDELEVNASLTFSFSVSVSDKTNNKVFKNTGFLTNSDDDFEIPSNTVVEELGDSLYEIEKKQSLNGGEATTQHLNANAGDLLTYTITVRNTGTIPIDNLNIIDVIPDGLILHEDSFTNGANLSGRTVTWLIPVLRVNESLDFSYTVTVPYSDEDWENTARAVSEMLDIPSNTVTVSSNKAHVTIEKLQSINGSDQTKDSLLANDGDVVTYYFKLKNDGEGVAKNLTVTDPVPKGLNVIEDSISDAGKLDSNNLSWQFDQIEPNEERILNFSAHVPKNNQVDHYSNKAQLNHSELEVPIESNSVELEQPRIRDVYIQKSQSISETVPTTDELTVGATEVVTYYLLVTNNGNTSIASYQVSDTIDDELTIIQATLGEDASVIGNTIVWTLSNLEPSSSRVLRFQVQVPSTPANKSWDNTASLILPEETISSNTVRITETVEPKASIVSNPPATSSSLISTNDESTVSTRENNTSNKSNLSNSTDESNNSRTSTSTNDSTRVSQNPHTGVRTFLIVWILACCVSLILLLSSFLYSTIKNLKGK